MRALVLLLIGILAGSIFEDGKFHIGTMATLFAAGVVAGWLLKDELYHVSRTLRGWLQ